MGNPLRVVALTLVLAAAAPARAQAPAAPAFGSSITVVTLPVFVTDAEGRAVAGLGPEDFEVFDDGRPMRLVGVREFDAGAPAALSLAAGQDSPAARRHFLLLFDLSFSGINGLVRAQKAALEFVTNHLGTTDLASVATFSANHGVNVLVGFTSDRYQLRRAVATLGVLQLDRHADPLGLAFDLRDLGAVAADTLPEERGEMVADSIRAIQIRFERAQEALYRQRVLALLDGMKQLATSLDAVQGRKQVIYFSNGFDETALEGQQAAQQIRDSEAVSRGRLWEVRSENRFGDTEIRQEMARMLQAFSSSDSLVHAVDLTGLSARGDVRQQSSEPVARSGQGSLSEMARLSGGRFFKNTNDPGVALGEIAEMSRRYYLLAFEPQLSRGPGRFHKLKVKVRGKDRHASHRSGYFERAVFAERPSLARRFEAAEIITKGVDLDDIPIRVLAVPYRDGDGKATLPVVVEADGPAVMRGAQGGRVSLEIYGYALDEAGRVADLVAFSSALDLSQAGERLRTRGLQCHATFTLPPGPHSLRFLVRDTGSGRSGSRRLDITVPDFDPSEVLLLPPLFMDEPGDWLILQAPSRSAPRPVLPFSVDALAFTPRARATLANGRTDRVCLMAYDAGRAYDPGASFEIKPQLVGADGAAVPVRVAVSKAEAGKDGFRRFVLEVTPGEVAPGEYALRVRLREPGSGRVSEAYQPVRVE